MACHEDLFLESTLPLRGEGASRWPMRSRLAAPTESAAVQKVSRLEVVGYLGVLVYVRAVVAEGIYQIQT
jgi:hypothetical protein